MEFKKPPCYAKDYNYESRACQEYCVIKHICKWEFKKALDAKVVSLTEYRIKKRGNSHEPELRS